MSKEVDEFVLDCLECRCLIKVHSSRFSDRVNISVFMTEMISIIKNCENPEDAFKQLMDSMISLYNRE